MTQPSVSVSEPETISEETFASIQNFCKRFNYAGKINPRGLEVKGPDRNGTFWMLVLRRYDEETDTTTLWFAPALDRQLTQVLTSYGWTIQETGVNPCP